jgi:hypothetical protein
MSIKGEHLLNIRISCSPYSGLNEKMSRKHPQFKPFSAGLSASWGFILSWGENAYLY